MPDSSFATLTIRMAAVLVLIGCLLGTGYALRVGIAQQLYRQAKFGGKIIDAESADRLCEKAFRLYPLNYYFASWTANRLFNIAGNTESGADSENLILRSRFWCDTGLKLNRYYRPLVDLKSRLLARNSLPDAIALWKQYVDWNFWDPYNHAVLAYFYADAGNIPLAMRELRWIRHSKYEADVRRAVNAAWRREKTILPSMPAR